MSVLILVDPVQVGLQGLPRRGLLVERGHIAVGALTDAQAAKQLVGVEQLGTQYFGQFAPGQAAHGFHLEQSVLGLHIAEGAIQVEFAFGANVRHAALVVTDRHRPFQMLQLHQALTRRLLAVHVPASADDEGRKQYSQ
ncbi:hypothetical protein D3C78_1407160 [compost metagenome]